MKKVLIGLAAAAALSLGVMYLWQSEKDISYIPPGEQGMVGATIPTVVSLFQTSLQSAISDSATSMTLVSGTDSAGNALSGFYCFTIDEGTSSAEFVCGTASGTSITGMTRGVSPTTGTSSVSSLRYSHRRGASVKITNYPQLAVVSRILNGNETLPNALRYDSGVSTTTLQSNGQYLASISYVNGVVTAGGVNATTTTQGLIQFATASQTGVGAIQGSTGAFLVPSNALFNATPQSATTVPVTNSSGKLAQGFLDLASSWTFTGAVTFNSATTTFNANTTFLALPTIQAGTPSATLATQLVPKQYVDSKLSTLATSTESVSFTVTHNSQATSTGMTITTDGSQSVVVNYAMAAKYSSDSQTHTDNVDILIDNVQVASYQVWSGQPATLFNAPASITHISAPLSAGSHTIKYRFRDSTAGTYDIPVIGLGSVYTIR